MFPNCCQIDIDAENDTYKIKSGNAKNIVISTNSSMISTRLQDSEEKPRPTFENIKFFVYHKSKKTPLSEYQCVERITAVSPVSMILFSGESNLGRLAFSMDRNVNEFQKLITTSSWLNFVSNNDDTELLYDLRCKFYNVFFDVIQSCHNNDKWERSLHNKVSYNHQDVINTVEKVLAIEDRAYNFSSPVNIGDRPRAFSHKFALAATTSYTECEKKFIEVDKIKNEVFKCFGGSVPLSWNTNRNRTFYIYRIDQKSNSMSHIQSFNYGHSLNFNNQMTNLIGQFFFRDMNQFAFLFFYALQEKEFTGICEMFIEEQESKKLIFFEELMQISFAAEDFE